MACMVVAAIVLVGMGVVLGFFFPVMFVVAAAGAVLFLLSLVAAGRRAKITAEETSETDSS